MTDQTAIRRVEKFAAEARLSDSMREAMDTVLARAKRTERAVAIESEQRAYCSMPCTLDGTPAKISGALLGIATVSALPDGPSYQYPWSTVARVMENGGAFKS